MKRNRILPVLIVLAATFLSVEVMAQSYPMYTGDEKTGRIYVPDYNYMYTASDDSTSEKAKYQFVGEQRTFYRKSGKEKFTSTSNYFYDDSMRLTKFVSYRNNKLEYSYHFTYAATGELLSQDMLNKKGEVEHRIEQEFGEHGLISYRILRKGKKETYRLVQEYNTAGKLTEARNYRNGKLFRKFTYAYYDSGEKKRTVSYNGRGKAKYVWEYACDPRGDEVKKSDTNRVCIKKEALENGGRMEVYITTSGKGELSKYVMFYTAQDQLYKQENYYKGSDRIRYVFDFDYAPNGKRLKYEYRYFHKNGQIIKHTRELRKGDNVVDRAIYSYNKRGKLKGRIRVEFVMGDRGQVISKTSYDINDKKSNETVYLYH